MAEKKAVQYDSDAVFISYSPEDIDWAEDELRPRLEKSGVKVITGENLTGGATVSLNRERAIANTRRTIVVLSPEWVANSWNSFEADILIHTDPTAATRKLLPVLLRKTSIPPRIARLTLRDLTDKKRYESRLAQLIRDIEDAVPVPPREIFPNRWEWYWRQARRRGATPGRVAVAGIGLALLFWLTLTSGPGWQPLPTPSLQEDGFARIFTADGVLFVASDTESGQYSGLWRSLDRGQTWESIGGFLDLGDERASVRDFAHTPTAIYAATNGAGLWRSPLTGTAWERVDPTALPEKRLHRVAIAADGRQLLVAGIVGGVFLSDGGDAWRQLDGQATCAGQPQNSLPGPLREAVVLVNGGELLVGSGGDPPGNSGLYASRDGGNCWQKLHGQEKTGSAQSGNQYLALAPLPNSDEILVLYRDHDAGQANPWNWLRTLRGQEPFWQSKQATTERILVSPTSPIRWYIATDDGSVASGAFPLSSADETDLPRLWPCVFLLCSVVDQTFDVDGETLLLLTNEHIYRQAIVPTFRIFWP